MQRNWLGHLAIGLGLALAWCGPALAHPFAYAAATTTLDATRRTVRLQLDAPNHALSLGLGRPAIQSYLARHLVIHAGGQPCALVLSTLGPVSGGGARLTGAYTCARPVERTSDLTIHSDLFLENFQNFDHFVTVVTDTDRSSLVFTRGHQDYPRTVTARTAAVPIASFFATAGQFLWLGIQHILTGPDHLLFLVSVVLLVRSVRRVLILVTTFTAAHTLTLILAGLQILVLSPRLVEPLIAATVMYMATLNLRTLWARRRPPQPGPGLERVITTGGFGLIHGLGFAGGLAAAHIPQSYFVPSLLFFNAGVEVGQLLVLAVVLPLLFLVSRLSSRRRLWLLISWLTVGVAATWFVQRLIGGP